MKSTEKKKTNECAWISSKFVQNTLKEKTNCKLTLKRAIFYSVPSIGG